MNPLPWRTKLPLKNNSDAIGVTRVGSVLRFLFCFYVWVLLTVAGTSRGALDTNSATGFFTDAGNRLLRLNTESWLRENPIDFVGNFGVSDAFGISNIPVFVSRVSVTSNGLTTNEIFGYTPAVHRVLQVVANIYDATTNRCDLSDYPYVPTVFRPIFRRDTSDEANVFIVGYCEVVDASMAAPATAPAMLDLQRKMDRQQIPVFGVAIQTNNLQTEPMFTGIPLVIGAKKGFPGFSKFALENTVRATRRLKFHREPGQPVSQTNQIYSFGISNAFGVQAWNSYSSAFPRNLKLIAVGDAALMITNEVAAGPNSVVVSNRTIIGVVTNIPGGGWPGFVTLTNASFRVPFITNRTVLTNETRYLQDLPLGGTLTNSSMNVWDPPNTFRIPKLWLTVRARVRFILVDVDLNRIVDYVNLDSSEPPVEIVSTMMADGGGCDGHLSSPDPDPDGFWCTNRVGFPLGGADPGNPAIPTYGIQNQINISRRYIMPPSDNYWLDYNCDGLSPNRFQEMQQFDIRLNPADVSQMTSPADVDFSTPFNPTRIFQHYFSWEANDPLVHYTVPDLKDLFLYLDNGNIAWLVPSMGPWPNDPIEALQGRVPLPQHVRPWGGNPTYPAATSPDTRWETAVKDPAIRRSDDWNFPSAEPLSFAMIGRVHRGTPWQTIYLKSRDVSDVMWLKWSGNHNLADARRSRPVTDRLLMTMMDALVNTNPPYARLSINLADSNAWLTALDGFQVISNSPTPIEMTIASNSIQAVTIVDGLQATRSVTSPNGIFASVADILATPQLAEGCPYINTNTLRSSTAGGISDGMMEAIPSELLPLLRSDSIGSASRGNGLVTIQFSGYDDCRYAIEASLNPHSWVRIATNSPSDGKFSITIDPTLLPRLYYRSVLLP